jgi:multisubunit Na+/H+ antiporter MnhF subunit
MLLVYFLIGFTKDALVARYTKCTCQGADLWAANLSVAIEILSIFVLSKIIIERNLAIAIAYFLGLWLGTYCATKLNK